MSVRQNISADIPERLRDADQALTAYGRWAMDRRGPQKCGSAEGMYRPERGEALEARREAREVLMPTPDALKVHRALLGVAELERKVLLILYVPQRMTAQMQLRIARIPPRLSQERHLAGLGMFQNQWQKVLAHRPETCYVRRQPNTEFETREPVGWPGRLQREPA